MVPNRQTVEAPVHISLAGTRDTEDRGFDLGKVMALLGELLIAMPRFFLPLPVPVGLVALDMQRFVCSDADLPCDIRATVMLGRVCRYQG
jgi:hypothetical protein